MSRRGTGLAEFLGEAICEAVFIAGPAWLINHYFRPFHLPQSWQVWGEIVAAVLGLVTFVAIGISRHPEARKVRIFGAAVAGAFIAMLLCVYFAARLG